MPYVQQQFLVPGMAVAVSSGFGSGALLTPAMQQQWLTLIPNALASPAFFGGENLSAGYGLCVLDTAGYLGHNGIFNGCTSDVYYDPAIRY